MLALPAVVATVVPTEAVTEEVMTVDAIGATVAVTAIAVMAVVLDVDAALVVTSIAKTWASGGVVVCGSETGAAVIPHAHSVL